jgi:copper chaperone NosL
MIISEERYAAGYITDSGEEFIFDDIGDLVKAYMQDQGDIKATFVHDYDNHTWIRGENAYYVLSPNLPTPMLSGLAAFPSIEMAEEFSAEMDGQVLTFDELLTYYRENSPEPAFSSLTGN